MDSLEFIIDRIIMPANRHLYEQTVSPVSEWDPEYVVNSSEEEKYPILKWSKNTVFLKKKSEHKNNQWVHETRSQWPLENVKQATIQLYLDGCQKRQH